MEHFHFRTSAGDAEDENFPTLLFPYRSFHCNNCRVHLVVCSRCDRNLIYCLSCRLEKKKIRNRKANKNYRATTHGKKMRAMNERQRRARRKEFVANRGSPPEQILSLPPVPAISGGPDTEGESDEISTGAEGQLEGPAGGGSGKHEGRKGAGSKRIHCSFCDSQCSEFQYFDTCRRWQRLQKKISEKVRGNFSTS